VKSPEAGRGTTKISGLESLRSFLRENRDAFADLSDLDDDARSALGYINRHNGHLEFLIENDRFENARETGSGSSQDFLGPA
jgi:hypothetical protein